jgi:hypothetical protein
MQLSTAVVPLHGSSSPVAWGGALSVQVHADGVQPWRLPHTDADLLTVGGELNTGGVLLDQAGMTAGVRLQALLTAVAGPASVAVTVAVRRVYSSGNNAELDCTLDGELQHSADLVCPEEADIWGEPQTITFTVPGGSVPRRLELWLPQRYQVKVMQLGLVGDAAGLQKIASDERPQWTCYGSSITHCGSSGACYSPSRTWPATVARTCDLDLLCLGFGGNCCLDPQVARTIRDLPPQCAITLKLGINMLETHTRRTFLPAALGFVLTVRDGHPTTPLLVCSPIYCPRRFRSGATGQLEEQETVPVVENGLCLQEMRTALRSLVESLQQRGDSNLHYLDGRELLGPHDDTDALLPDGVHPSERGYELMGERFAALGFGKTGRLRTSSSRRAASCKL